MAELTEFGRLVKAHLARKGLEQQELAREIGLIPESLTKALRGYWRPREKLVIDISRALDLSSREEQELLAAAGYVSPVAYLHHPISADTRLYEDIEQQRAVKVLWNDVRELVESVSTSSRLPPKSLLLIGGFIKEALEWLQKQDEN